jgi:hypothetical protein
MPGYRSAGNRPAMIVTVYPRENRGNSVKIMESALPAQPESRYRRSHIPDYVDFTRRNSRRIPIPGSSRVPVLN